MQFIKENLFYSSLVAIVVVVGGALVTMNVKTSETTYGLKGSKEAPSMAMSRRILSQRTMPQVNDRVNRAREAGVKETEKLLRRVAANAAGWSRGDGRDRYTPMVLPKWKGGKQIGTTPAFPITRTIYDDFALPYYGSKEYVDRMTAIFKRLYPTLPPTDKEIQGEAERNVEIADHNRRMRLHEEEMQRLKDEARGKGAEDGGERTPKPPVRDKRSAPVRIDPDRRAGGPVVGPDGKEEPQIDFTAIALDNMRRFKAGLALREREGKDKPPAVSIFADPDKALELIFQASDPDATDVDLWDAQVHLWIVEDIVDAIAGVNDMSLKKPKGFLARRGGKPTTGPAITLPLPRTVPNSAIKHLVTIDVTRGYVVGQGGNAGAGAPGVGKRPRPVPPPMHGDGNRNLGPAAPIGTGNNITGRTTCKQYEIKHYSFTVIMDLRYLPDLQKAILTNNQHTILNVTMVEPDISDSDTNRYFYGTEAVMQVTIEGELLMLSDWTRGKWLADQNTWAEGYEPLMPAKVLRAIHNQNPGALRDEDAKRMNEEK